MSRILVTGSRGVIGSYLVKILKENGHEVFGIDISHDIGEVGWQHPMSADANFYARCDISNYRQLSRIFEVGEPFDFVYNTAAEFGRWNGEDYYEQLWKTNAIGTKNIIRLQEKYRFKLIHFSSSEVYGDYQDVMYEDVMDKYEIKQLNDYAMTKWVNEMQIRNSAIQYNTETVIVRIFNTYGPGEWYHPYRSVNSKFCYNALHGIPTTVYKGHYRTSLYLKDACNTLSNIVKFFKPGKVYNIGGTEHHSIEELVDIVWKEAGSDRSLLVYEDSEILTTKTKKIDVSRAVNDLAHKSTITLEQGVNETLAWMKSYYKKVTS